FPQGVTGRARDRDPGAEESETGPVRGDPEVRAAGVRLTVEGAVGAVVAVYVERCPEIVGAGRVLRAVVLLAGGSGAAEVATGETGEELVAPDRDHRRKPDVQLPPVVPRGPKDRLGRDLRLENGR